MVENAEREQLLPRSVKSLDEPIGESTLIWSNLSVETPPPNLSARVRASIRRAITKKEVEAKSRVLLHNLTGIAKPGEVLAIMGTSGAGKTTLLNALSGHSGDNVVIPSGDVYLNGKLTRESERQKNGIIGYVEQREFFIETLSVKEHLTFQAMLGMRRALPEKERHIHVKNTINELRLNKTTTTTIKFLSGGEKKRLALATVFLNEPHVLLIDEPTSGLDAYLAYYIMQTIQTMAVKQRKTIVVVIHQPTTDMFDLIDYVYLLIRGGKQAFFGTKDQAFTFFTSDCHLIASSLDGFIEQLAPPPSKDSEQQLLAQKVADQYNQSDYARSLETNVRQQLEQGDQNSFSNIEDKPNRTSFLCQLKWLLWRAFLADLRNVIRLTFVFVRALTLALIFGLLFFRLCDSQYFIQNVNAVNVTVVSLIINTGARIILSSMPINNSIGIRENHRGMYGMFAYYLAFVLHELPTLIIFPFLVDTIIYWMSEMDNSWSHFFSFVGIGILASNLGAAVGELFSSFTNSIEAALAMAVPVLQTLAIFSGFFVSLSGNNILLEVIPYISPFYYAYSTLLTLQWGSNPDATELQSNQCLANLFPNNSQTISTITTDSVTADDLCRPILQHVNAQDVLGHIGLNILMFFVLYFVCHFIAFFSLWYRAHKKGIREFFSKQFSKSNKTYQSLQ